MIATSLAASSASDVATASAAAEQLVSRMELNGRLQNDVW